MGLMLVFLVMFSGLFIPLCLLKAASQMSALAVHSLWRHTHTAVHVKEAWRVCVCVCNEQQMRVVSLGTRGKVMFTHSVLSNVNLHFAAKEQ